MSSDRARYPPGVKSARCVFLPQARECPRLTFPDMAPLSLPCRKFFPRKEVVTSAHYNTSQEKRPAAPRWISLASHPLGQNAFRSDRASKTTLCCQIILRFSAIRYEGETLRPQGQTSPHDPIEGVWGNRRHARAEAIRPAHWGHGLRRQRASRPPGSLEAGSRNHRASTRAYSLRGPPLVAWRIPGELRRRGKVSGRSGQMGYP